MFQAIVLDTGMSIGHILAWSFLDDFPLVDEIMESSFSDENFDDRGRMVVICSFTIWELSLNCSNRSDWASG